MTDREIMQQALEALEIYGANSPDVDQTIDALRERLAQSEQEPVALVWVKDGDNSCGYNNWVAETPLGRILITWKGWKEYHDACVDEFPGSLPSLYGSPDDVKQEAEAEFFRRVASVTTPPRREWQGLTEEEVRALWESHTMTGAEITRAIEAKLREKNT